MVIQNFEKQSLRRIRNVIFHSMVLLDDEVQDDAQWDPTIAVEDVFKVSAGPKKLFVWVLESENQPDLAHDPRQMCKVLRVVQHRQRNDTLGRRHSNTSTVSPAQLCRLSDEFSGLLQNSQLVGMR